MIKPGKKIAVSTNLISFEQVLKDEKSVTGDKDNLIGLAFSGGGIRSATVNLGVLQALANRNLIGKFDYLSTVSGGGYIGGFFSSLMHHAKGDLSKVNQQLNATPESEQVNFLRKYSHYLTPKIGLSTDTMAAFAIWLTNTLLNQAVLISAIASVCAIGFILNELALRLHQNIQLSTAVVGLMFGILAFLLAIRESMQNFQTDALFNKIAPPTHWRAILCTGLFGVILISLWITSTKVLEQLRVQPHHDMYLSPFWMINLAIILLISLGIIVGIGLAGRGWSIKCFHLNFFVNSYVREWWARSGGITLYLCMLWFLGYLFVLYIPLYLDNWLTNNTLSSVSAWGVIASISAYLGKAASTSGINTTKIKERITTVLPWVVIAGLIILVSYAVFELSKILISDGWSNIEAFLLITSAFTLLTIILAWRVDVNIFSLHYFYRNRLTRAYLGATNPNRHASLFTGFDPNDEITFARCRHRPLHIVNTSINLTNTKDLAWQQRMAAAFAFTPLHTGFQFPDYTGGYRPTAHYGAPKGVALGSIMSVSGAAASPNSGYHTSPAAAFIMTMFNARLGRWCGNPLKKKWRTSSPAFGLGYLTKELFAQTNIDSSYVYLSDGGHFENLGIYELARRKCKLIIALDCGQDGDYQFEDLGNAIRKCKIDLSANINININDLHPTEPSAYGDWKNAKKHYAIGRITYADQSQGILLYIKNSLTGNEPTDLINYKLEKPDFPHHSTIDQFFNESQFESYRHLGQHMMEETLADIMSTGPLEESDQPELIAEIRALLN